MQTREQLINLRIFHVLILLTIALFVYQFSQWDDGLWVPISVVAIIGPFRPGLTITKAKQRVLGSIAGLLLSLILWWIIHFNYNLLIAIVIILVYCLAFSAQQEYTYFIMLVSILICLNFDYMNLFFNNEIIYLVNRIICVLTAVIICLFFEYCVFKQFYKNAVGLVEQDKIENLLNTTNEQFNSLSNNKMPITVTDINKCIWPLSRILHKL